MPRSRGRHLTLPRFHSKHSRNLKLLYSLRVSRDLISKFTMFFLPIYLYQIGSSTDLLNFIPVSSFERGMLIIGLYFLVSHIIGAITTIPSGNLAVKIGYQKTFVISYLLFFVQLLLLYLLGSNTIFMIFLASALLNGLQSPLFWCSYLTLLSRNTKQATMGQELGVLQLLIQVVAVVAPAISGLLAYLIGMEVLFLLGIVATLVSVILVLLMDEKEVSYSVSWKEFFTWLKDRSYERLAVSMAGSYVYDAVVFLWPLYVFLLVGSIDKVGYLYTISLFLAMLVTFFTGVYIDNSKSKKPFYLSGGVLSVVWLARTQIIGVWGIVFSETVDRLASNVNKLFFDTALIKRSKGSTTFAYFIYREVIISFSAIAFWLFYIIFFLMHGGWIGLFIFASIGSMLSLLIRESKLPASSAV